MHEQGQLTDAEFGLLKAPLLADYQRQADAERAAAEAAEEAERKAAVAAAEAKRMAREAEQQAQRAEAERVQREAEQRAEEAEQARHKVEAREAKKVERARRKDDARQAKKVVQFSAAHPPIANPERWAEDPAGRHQLRYWDGARWTRWVSDGDSTSEDPIEAGTSATSGAQPGPEPLSGP